MDNRVDCAGLQVDERLHALLEQEIIPGTGIDTAVFWQGLADLLSDFMPRNAELLQVRESLQAQLDAWHRQQAGKAIEPSAYRAFLEEIGYLLPQPRDVQVTTDNVDDEIARIAGPQLVVPVMNARFALNAVNARWGSLYDALYGTDAIGEDDGAERGPGYNPTRGQRVIAWGRKFLDEHFPLATGSHVEARRYSIAGNVL